ncbi:class I SAM-dependent methyltransferase [Streptomyces sp. SID13726]|uniref:class I SAM-dependent methyltransferase n=1 Tax=Streptomyces sp. SID13726 TaxID=2706058 RepID=UPI0013B7AF59|nr:class I SAM-dependent methyltransferase [Streptomyces sp. SID13726]NEA98182.1 class I SAM-dependent methyltransferase [Streptomyces sp. SID13726]
MTETTPRVHQEILAYYARGGEDARLRPGGATAGRLEFWRTQEVLRRLLPGPPARVLDVGGGSGVHAEWLVADGYTVDLVDPVPLHVRQAARIPGVTAHTGDARELSVPDDTYDAVLLLGPLYHLPERPDRTRVLAEAHRVVRPGGPVVAATINRYAQLHDLLHKESYFTPGHRERTDAVLVDGRHPFHDDGFFTVAHFAQPDEVRGEFTEARLTVEGQYGVEGVAWLLGGVEDWLDDPERRETLLAACRHIESEPTLLGVSGHLLTAGRRPL